MAEQEQLFDTSKASARTKRAATAYKKASEEKSQSLSAFNGKRDSLIEIMMEEGDEAVEVELGGVRKIIRLEELHKLKIEAAKEAPVAGE